SRYRQQPTGLPSAMLSRSLFAYSLILYNLPTKLSHFTHISPPKWVENEAVGNKSTHLGGDNIRKKDYLCGICINPYKKL
ncbi:MAG: hypothetical protein IJL50_11125, partial [Bacteroidaceae bacterium]|nr:hypothetical protein [Bacteroidaceae bacterium]